MADIQNMTEDWQGHSGAEVQAFLKQQIAAAQAAAGEKIGYVEYTGNAFYFYEDDTKQHLISTVTLSGYVYRVDISTSEESPINVLSSDTSKSITFSAQSYRGTVGSEMTAYDEDHNYVIGIDNGSGMFTTIQTGTLIGGAEGTVNFRRYLTTGANRLRITMTGVESNQQTSKIMQVNLTTLTLDVNFAWYKPWIQDEDFVLNGIYFSGNLQKTLYIAMDDVSNIIAQPQFPSGTNYTTSDYRFNLTEYFPDDDETSGIHTLYVWMEGGGVSTSVFEFNVMCVLAAEKTTAQLIAVNNVAPKVENYVEGKLFEYSLYGVTTVTVEQTVTDGVSTVTSSKTVTGVQTQVKNDWMALVEFETESASANVTLDITAGTAEEELEYPLDNSTAYLPTPGAKFYMNAANRSNGSADREYINNIAQNAAVEQYKGVWNNFSWGSSDGWTLDGDNHSALVVKAGSKVSFGEWTSGGTTHPALELTSQAASKSISIEIKFRVSNIADYEKPVLILAPETDNTHNVGYTEPGIYIYPTKLTVLNSAGGSSTVKTLQSIGLKEGTIHHIVIVLQRDYAGTGNCLCSIYMNGNRNIHFEYSTSSEFGDSPLVIGQASTDVCVYMMRYYEEALQDQQVLANFINTIIDGDEFTRSGVREGNDIVDNGISYDMAKKAGYACMVVECNDPIPDLLHQTDRTCNLRLEYGERDDRNLKVTNVRLSGQGTTSMQYYRWNLRFRVKNKINNVSAVNVWTYGDGSSESGVAQPGWIDGKNVHPKVVDIVAKKNYASAMQGHKMGAVGLYDELYKRVLDASALPEGARVSVYQYPFLGFQKFNDGTYQYIGLYTVGPHKGDVGTFGYDKNAYPNLMSLEGPNHAPLGTRFLHPWMHVDYDYTQETLTFGGEEGWDADFMAGLTTDDQEDKAAILARYTAEWAPAYEIVFFCSPYLKSFTELGSSYNTLAKINAAIDDFRQGTTDGVKNELLQVYDSSNYKLYAYDNQEGEYVEVKDHTGATHDMLDYLEDYLDGSASTSTETITPAADPTAPTTAELIYARHRKFRMEAGDTWQTKAILFHFCFCVLIAATDNYAKNMYPFKFQPLASGGKWSFRQDDLDSILDTDNNGMQTKPYYVLPGDKNAGNVEIYQGGDSALYAVTELAFTQEIIDTMRDIVAACSTLASDLSIAGDNLHDSLFNVFAYYFWNRSAKYFPQEAYNKDTEWSYITPWVADHTMAPNGVKPLTQARGDAQYSEREWVTKHIAFIFSRYQIGGFTGGSATYGSFSFTPVQAFTFAVVPAIELYPSANVGGNGTTSSGTDIQGARTHAGDACQLQVPGTGATNVYLQGTDWLSYYGDICGLQLTDRGGSGSDPSNIAFTGKRLRKIKIGDATASNVKFNAVGITIADTPLLEEIDARNNTTLESPVDLTGCPRLRKALFAGSGATDLYLPEGAQLTEVSLPDGLQTLFLKSLPTINDEILSMSATCKASISSLYVYQCPEINPIELLIDLYESADTLQYITLIWDNVLTGDASYFETLYNIARNIAYSGATKEYHDVVIASNGRPDHGTGIPVIEGQLYVDDYVNATQLALVQATWPNLTVNCLGATIDFEDQAVKTICVNNWGGVTGGSTGIPGKAGEITMEQAAAVSSVGTLFRSNTSITKFNELYFFSNADVPGNAFQGCTALREVSLPKNMIALPGGTSSFKNNSNMKVYFAEGYKELKYSTFGTGNNNVTLVLPTTLTKILGGALYDGSNYVLIVKAATPMPADVLSARVSKVYVPDNSVDAYKAASGWSPMASKIYPLSQYDGSIVSPVW